MYRHADTLRDDSLCESQWICAVIMIDLYVCVCRIVSGGWDQKMHTWNTETGQLMVSDQYRDRSTDGE